MFSTISSAAAYGIEARIIQVEADVSNGLPIFNMVGYLSSEVREAKDRVRTALKNSGFHLNPKHITINLSPADIRKAGTGFDLPVAIAVLAASETIPRTVFDDTLIVGELGLEGTVKSIAGVLPIVLAAKDAGCRCCLVPLGNAMEGAVVTGIDVIGIPDLASAVRYLTGEEDIPPTRVDIEAIFDRRRNYMKEDFADVSGQQAAKRAAEIAVSGRHNILLSGPPGSGKTMLAKRMAGIMPLMTFDESLVVSRIYSIAGKLDNESCLVAERPFNAPHHTATVSSVIGGGMFAAPGAVSLSHNGVLFLDELPEFNREVIESLRQPLEDRKVTISRLNATYTYPAGFMLVASMNPCPCGYYPDRRRCTCTFQQIQRYRSRISQPILDRIDLCINVNRVEYQELGHRDRGAESSEMIRQRVEKVRKIQAERYAGTGISFNSELDVASVRKYCALEPEGQKLMEEAYRRLDLSARGYYRVLRVARTIADMAGSEGIRTEHLAEALSYRDYSGGAESL